MEFLVKTMLGPDQVMAYQKAAGKTVEKTKTYLLRGGLLIFGALSIVGSCTSIGMGFVDSGVIMGIVLGLIALAWGLSWWKIQTRRITRNLPPSYEQEFYFNRDGIVALRDSEHVNHSYDDFFALAESEQYFFLFLSKRAGYVLDKAGFTTGTAAEFGTFIKQRTGKDLPFVKI